MSILSNLISRGELQTHALALDISTESVLGGFYEKRGASSRFTLKKPAVFRYPIRFIYDSLIKERQSNRVNQLFEKSVSNALSGFYKQIKHADFLYVNFSDPFVVDKILTKKIIRNPSETISASEIANLQREIETEANKASAPLITVGAEALIHKVNGYGVENAAGYKGKTLELEVFFTLINPEIKTILETAREKFFPKSRSHYFSDSRLMWHVLKTDLEVPAPYQVLDIDGEVTGVYFWVGGLPPQHVATIPFGGRTLERKISSAMNLTEEDSRSLLARYADGVLDSALVKKIEISVLEAIRDWQEKVIKSTAAQIVTRNAPGCAIFGRSPTTKLFYEFLKKETGSEKTVIFTGQDFMLKAMIKFCGLQ